jgi:hypothetical protein
MNERIRKFAKKSGFSLDSNDIYTAKLEHLPITENMEKFAELIVKKFDDILLLQQLDCIGNHDKKSAELIEQIRDKTKTYFGVE